MNSPEVVLGVTGSIGAYKAGDIVRQLRETGYAVTCVLTEHAQRFIAATTLQALSERKAYTDLFDQESPQIAHTALAERARAVVVAPATANIIGKFASGLANDLLSCILLVTRAKIIFAPAMNVHMWQHPTVQRNVTVLKRLGVRFVGPDVGKLACGYEAIGHLAETDEIVRAVKQLVPAVSVASGTAVASQPKSSRPRGGSRARQKRRTRRKRRR